MLEQVGRIRRRALPKQQPRLNEPVDRRMSAPPACAPRQRARACENSRPITAPICAASLAEPKPVEPRHQRSVQARRDRQRRRRNDGDHVRSGRRPRPPPPARPWSFPPRRAECRRCARRCPAAGSPAKRVSPATRSIIASISLCVSRLIVSRVTCGSPIHGGENSGRNVTISSTRRPAIRSTVRLNSFQAGRIGPVRIFEDHQHRVLTRQRFHLRDRALPAFSAGAAAGSGSSAG